MQSPKVSEYCPSIGYRHLQVSVILLSLGIGISLLKKLLFYS